ncbi:MAG: WYL domain-containing protein [Bacilli bacterium]|jgi:predicted DNA-binding transcriptional regulator YafY|nr:WYL domain-containing protein [Bacilli bacterium]
MANRVAKCIKMLEVLRSGQRCKKEDLARILDTNPRNIIEFKRELEDAGYIIDFQSGKHGGYKLVNECFLPPLRFSQEEETALLRSEKILKHNEFLHYKSFMNAMDKIKAVINTKELNHESYINMAEPFDIDIINDIYNKLSDAINKKSKIKIKYKKINSATYKEYLLNPYELVHNHGFWYLLAIDADVKSKKLKDKFKFFKLTSRIKEVTILNKPFYYDEDFNVKDYVGKMSLFNTDSYDIELIASGAGATSISEKKIGLNPSIEVIDQKNNIILYKTTIEGKYNAIAIILSLGQNAKLLKPKELVDEIKDNILNMEKIYDEYTIKEGE